VADRQWRACDLGDDGTQIKAADYLKVGQSNVGVPSPDWHFAETGDYNGDGKSDLLWRTDNGRLPFGKWMACRSARLTTLSLDPPMWERLVPIGISFNISTI